MAVTPYTRQTSFAFFTAENPGEPHSGVDLDTEFNALKVALDETQSSLAGIQDDDGVLKRGSVGRAQLDSSITIGFQAPGAWSVDTLYEADLSTVFYQSKFYVCVETHTSGSVFDSGKWEVVADFTLQNTLGDGDVTTPKLADSAVTTAKLAPLAVTTAKMDSLSVTTPKLANEAVTTAKLAAASVTSDKVDSSVWSTGDIKLTLKNTADTGWRMFDDGTIGDASSGATYANVNAEALFRLMFDNFSDANCALTTSAGGATTRATQVDATTAWAAHCRIALPKVLGRSLAIAGAGSGLTSRTLGATAGTETQTLTVNQLPEVTPAGSVSVSLANATNQWRYVGPGSTAVTTTSGGESAVNASSSNVATISATATFTGTKFGAGESHSIVQPSSFLNAMVKL